MINKLIHHFGIELHFPRFFQTDEIFKQTALCIAINNYALSVAQEDYRNLGTLEVFVTLPLSSGGLIKGLFFQLIERSPMAHFVSHESMVKRCV